MRAIANKDFESNCKRIAKRLTSELSDPNSDWYLYDHVNIPVSEALYNDVTTQGKRKYLAGINKYLREITVTKLDCISFIDNTNGISLYYKIDA